MVDEVELGVVREDGAVEEIIGLVVPLGLTQYPVDTLVVLGFERKGPNRIVKKIHRLSEGEKMALEVRADTLWSDLPLTEKVGMLCRFSCSKAKAMYIATAGIFQDIEAWQDVLVR